MQNFLETVFQLDAADDVVALHHFVSQHHVGDIFFAVQQLLIRHRLRSAYVLAMLLDKSGQRHGVISIALVAGAIAYGKAADEARGLAMLHAQAAAQPVEYQTYIIQNILPPVMVALSNVALPKSDEAMLLRAVELLKAAVPAFRSVFDWSAPVPELSLEEMRQRGRARARLIKNPLPPPDVPRERRRVLVCMGGHHRGLRLRVMGAMTHYGWQVEHISHALERASAVDDCRSIIEICRQTDRELLVFDSNQLFTFGDAIKTYQEMKAQLRMERPSLKVLGLISDVDGGRDWKILQRTGDFFDGLVSYGVPVQAALQNPEYTRKILRSWGPYFGERAGKVDLPLIPRPLFDGTIHAANWTRLFWHATTQHMGLPIRWILNAFSYTDPVFSRSPAEHYSNYRSKMEEATCCLSLGALSVDSIIGQEGLRPDSILTGRSFESTLSGALLIQELSSNMDLYFVAGDHYLEFSSLTELASIIRFITEHREEAEAVRRCGHAFAHEHYSSEKIVGYIDKFLYFPD